ncbi:MAG: threonine aldolase [Thermoleophilia bacterium]|nr:threonine aldolase [Thermoleophilia bacterium]
MAGRAFASDNWAGVHPDLLAALAAANDGHAPAYGEGDPYTARAEERFREVFGADACTFFVLTGTGANVLALGSLLRSHEAVICPEEAHVNADECGAPERFLGSKLLPVPAPDGKLTPALVESRARGFGVQHRVQPRVVSISQTTERGTVYTLAETRALAERAHALGLRVHMDGARIANAAAALGVSLREATRDAGVDVLSFGGTKNGALAAEAVVFFDAALAEGFAYARKQGLQLASKQRFVAVQLDALLAGELWRRNAGHANAMAARLAAAIGDLSGIDLAHPVEANAVFVRLPARARALARGPYPFHILDEASGLARLMTSWDTTAADVDGLAAALAAALRA